MTLPSYKSLYQCINDMDEDQKQDIARKIQTRVGNVGILAVKEFIRNSPEGLAWIGQQLTAK